MTSLPNAEQLSLLRENLRKRKNFPKELNALDGLRCGCPNGDNFNFSQEGNDFKVEWSTVTNGVRSASNVAYCSALCSEEKYEQARLELGWIIADAFQRTADYMLEAIPGPREAMAAHDSYSRRAKAWRYWAIVSTECLLSLKK